MAAELFVERTGAGDLLVLLHGIATDSRIWSTVLPRLSRAHTVLAVDLPGFGRSEPVGEGFDLAAVAAAIMAGLRAEGISGPVDLVGHSLGGGVAIQLAAQFPAAVARLVLVAPAGLRPFPAPIAALIGSERLAGLLAGGADAFLAARRSAAPLTDLVWGRRLLLGLAVADGAHVPPAVARGMLDASLSARRTGPALATITTTDLRPLLAQVTAPVGAIWGEADQTVPIRGLDELLSVRPESSVIRLADTGHVPMVEQPEAFVDALEGLIEDDTTEPALAPNLR